MTLMPARSVHVLGRRSMAGIPLKPAPAVPRRLVVVLAQALHLVVALIPMRRKAGTFRSALDHPRGGTARRRAPDPFVSRIPPISDRWLADHRRRAGQDGQHP